MRLYQAGPMTGIPDHNYPEFRRVTEFLRSLGHKVESPVELNEIYGIVPNPDGSITAEELALCFKRNVESIFWCEGIALMDGWSESSGARVEAQLGIKLNKKFLWANTGVECDAPKFNVQVI